MTQYSDKVEKHKEKMEAEEWGKKSKIPTRFKWNSRNSIQQW
jgi:hypothetical protein